MSASQIDIAGITWPLVPPPVTTANVTQTSLGIEPH